MFKLQSWVTGLLILTVVVAALFGALYFAAQNETVQAMVFSNPSGSFEGAGHQGGRRGPNGEGRGMGRGRQFSADLSSEFDSEGGFLAMVNEGHSHGRMDISRGVGSLVRNLVKIGLVILVVGIAFPLVSRYWRGRQKGQTA